jgi:AcrR family transcriptional regulator
MRKSDPAKNDLVRDEILRAATGLFQTYGLDKTTMEDIAGTAGKGKSTLYYYFRRKEDVFYAVAGLERLDMLEIINKGIRWAHSAEEKLRLFFTIRSNAIKNKAKLYAIAFRETRKHIQLFHRIQRESNTAEVKIMRGILLEGIAAGEFKSIKQEECETIAITGISTLHGMDLNLLLDGKMPSAEARLGAVLNVFIRGLK